MWHLGKKQQVIATSMIFNEDNLISYGQKKHRANGSHFNITARGTW